MHRSAEQLISRSEPRKLLIVVTGGDPAERAACAETIQRCWAGGIEVLGLGIKVPGVSGLFPVSECVEDLGELTPALFRMLQAALTRRAA